MLLKHNQIVLPAIERHEGKVIEVIGGRRNGRLQ